MERDGFLYNNSKSSVNGTAAVATAAPVSPTRMIETTARLDPVISRGSAARRVGDALKSGVSVHSTLDSTDEVTSA